MARERSAVTLRVLCRWPGNSEFEDEGLCKGGRGSISCFNPDQQVLALFKFDSFHGTLKRHALLPRIPTRPRVGMCCPRTDRSRRALAQELLPKKRNYRFVSPLSALQDPTSPRHKVQGSNIGDATKATVLGNYVYIDGGEVSQLIGGLEPKVQPLVVNRGKSQVKNLSHHVSSSPLCSPAKLPPFITV